MSNTPRRGGCATFLGIVLIVSGSLFLFANLFGWSLLAAATQALFHFSTYWPALLIVWGAFKLYQRVTNPDGARVGGGEIVLLLLLILGGVSLTITRRAIDRFSGDLSWDQLLGMVDPESRGPVQRFSEEQRVALDGDLPLVLENRRGSIRVEGWNETEAQAILVKRLYHRSRETAGELADSVELAVDRQQGQRLRVEIGAAIDADHIETDIELKLPRSMEVKIENGRGPVWVSGLSNGVTVTTSYDPTEIERIEGDVRVESRRGPVRVREVSGRVEIYNQHGSITASEVGGDLVAETRNASIRVQDVTGTARLKDRHARIHALRVQGDLTVEATHTEVHAEGLGSSANIGSTYRPITVIGAAQGVSVEARNSEVEITRVEGDVNVDTIYRPVSVTRVQGTTTVRARQARVQLSDNAGPIDVETSDHRVQVRNPGTSVRVVSSHSSVELDATEINGEVDLQTTYGDITLSLPESSSFSFQGSLTDGELRSGFDVSDWNESDSGERTQWSGTHGSGGSIIKASTSYGDLILEAKSP